MLGPYQGCLIATDGGVRCWGANAAGVLGDGTTTDRAQPVSVAGLRDARSLVTNNGTTCAIHGEGHVACWGLLSTYFAPTAPSTTCTFQGRPWPCHTTPVEIPALDGTEQLELDGPHYLCARRADHSVVCGGLVRGAWRPLAEVAELRGAVRIAALEGNDCALDAAGGLRCRDRALEQAQELTVAAPIRDLFASDRRLCVATDASTFCAHPGWHEREGGPSSVRFEEVAGLGAVREIDANQYAGCARTPAGHVACWGQNFAGTLGQPEQCTGSPVCPSPAREVPGIDGAVDIAVSSEGKACALDATDTVRCWGRMDASRLDQLTPWPAAVPVDGVAQATQLCAGEKHTCALISDGTVRCWGDNEQGQLGTGGREPGLVATQVPNLGSVVQIACRPEATCAVLADGSVRCWGEFSYGGSLRPTVDTTWQRVRRFVMHGGITCAKNDAGEVSCTGAEFGHGDGLVRVPALDSAVELAGSLSAVCGQFADGRVRCAGQNIDHGLGTDKVKVGATSEVPVEVEGLTGVTQLVLAPWLGIAKRRDGSVWAWGSRWGLDAKAKGWRAAPMQLPASALIASNGVASCVGDRSGDVQCKRRTLAAFAPVAGLAPAVELVQGLDFVCARHTDGTVACTGANDHGELGRGTSDLARPHVVFGRD